MYEIPEIVKELRELEINNKTPNIVNELRELEKSGKLKSKQCQITNTAKNYIDTTFIKTEKQPPSKKNTIIQNDLTRIIQGSKMLFDLSPEGIAIIDKNGHFLDANIRICEWFEYDYNEIIEKNIFDFQFIIKGNELSIKNLFINEIKDDDVI